MSLLQTLLACCRSSEADEDPERQQLLNPDIIPQAPVQEPSRTNQEQEEDRRALDLILHKTQDRLVSITSSSPFLPSHTPSSSTSPPSPTLSTSTLSTTPWRPTPDQPVRIISLASALDPHQSPSAFLRANGYSTTTNGTRAGRRPASSHSLKTLTRSGATTARQQNGRPSPLGRRPTSDGEFDDGVQEEEEEDREGEIDLYGTVASYRTAREGTIGRGTLKGLWDGYDEGAEERELTPEEHDQLKRRNQQLAEAIDKLESSAENFRLAPVGPLVESWPA